jgi:hypothetical protein
MTHRPGYASAAKRLGLTLNEYSERVTRGQSHCRICRRWHDIGNFHKDPSSTKGISSRCKDCSREYYKKYRPRIGKWQGNPERDGDKRQANAKVRVAVQNGRMPRPSDVPCFDCRHIGPDRRHEYDHYRGYSAGNHLQVQAVCKRCHALREVNRRKSRRVASINDVARIIYSESVGPVVDGHDFSASADALEARSWRIACLVVQALDR